MTREKEKVQKLKKQPYMPPVCEIIAIDDVQHLLAGSPPVRPGGDAQGNVTVRGLTVDDTDNELVGTTSVAGSAKQNLWSGWDQ